MVTRGVHSDKVRVEKHRTLRSALAKGSIMNFYSQDQRNCSKTNFASDTLHQRPAVKTNGVSLIGPELSLFGSMENCIRKGISGHVGLGSGSWLGNLILHGPPIESGERRE